MQEQNQLRNPKENEEEESKEVEEEEEEEEPLTEKIERETSRLDPDPLQKMNKRINKLYGWIWALLGFVALLFIIFLLVR